MTNLVVLGKPVNTKIWAVQQTVVVDTRRQETGVIHLGNTEADFIHSVNPHRLYIQVRDMTGVFIAPTGGNELPVGSAKTEFGRKVVPFVEVQCSGFGGKPPMDYRVIHKKGKEL